MEAGGGEAGAGGGRAEGQNAGPASGYTDAEDGLVVAMVYPIHETAPSMPPTIIRTDSCSTTGLHSESMSRYAYATNPATDRAKIAAPAAFRLPIPAGAGPRALLV